MKIKHFLSKNIKHFAFGMAIMCGGVIFAGCNPTMDITNPTNSLQTPAPITGTITQELSINGNQLDVDMIERYQEACVAIKVTNSQGVKVSTGSGVAVYAGGYVVTNWHVISYVDAYPEQYKAEVIVYKDGEFESFESKLVWSNINFDLAVLDCVFDELPYVSMSDRWIDSDNKIRITEQVWALSTPYDLSLQNTFSTGYISSGLERVSTSSNRVYESLIQHTCPISNGSSGSPLFDLQGNLIGINTLGVTSSSTVAANDLYFATPIYPIVNVIAKIVTLNEDNDVATKYTLPLIGVSGYDSIMSSYFGQEFSDSGVYAEEVTIGGASAGKIEAKDVIIGLSITAAESPDDKGYFEIEKRNDLLYALTNFDSGDSIKLYILRNSVNFTYVINLG